MTESAGGGESCRPSPDAVQSYRASSRQHMHHLRHSSVLSTFTRVLRVSTSMSGGLITLGLVLSGTLLFPVIASATNGIGTGVIENPLAGGCEDIRGCVEKVVDYALGLATTIALAGVVYGGFVYLSSAGSPERIEAGKNAVTYSVVGLIVIGLSYAIVRAVFLALGGT